MKPNPTRPPPSNWPLEHPYLYIYTVITTMLLVVRGAVYLANWLNGALP